MKKFSKISSYLLLLVVCYFSAIYFLMFRARLDGHSMVYHETAVAVEEVSEKIFLPDTENGFYEKKKKYIQGRGCSQITTKGAFSKLHTEIYKNLYDRLVNHEFLHYDGSSLCITSWFYKANEIFVRIEGKQGFFPLKTSSDYTYKYVKFFKKHPTEVSNVK